jgi:hypothetical protein
MVAALVVASACGGATSPCVLVTSEGCDAGLVCEETVGDPVCTKPVVLAGRVMDALDAHGLAGARVLAADANGAVKSPGADSSQDGSWRLRVPARRDAEGAPLPDQHVTLRVDADGYQAFPLPPRVAVPLDLADAAVPDGGSEYELRNAATDVVLIALPAGTRFTVSGAVEGGRGGILVVADQGGHAVSTAITDAGGGFRLFNVPAGATSVSGYAAGLGAPPVTIQVIDADVSGVALVASAGDLATVKGSVNMVNAPGGARTSVILVVESTFQADAARGEAPAGLRAADVSGAFSIPDVPPGRYVALAAFENDGLVRDPDTEIGGTALVHVEVVSGQPVASLPQSFKVTGALAVESPGADAVDTVTTPQPAFVWEDDSSEDGYELDVFDALGNRVYHDADVPRVTGSATVTSAWAGASPVPGMLYQFRARSFRIDKQDDARHYISATEDLRGVFLWQPASP